MWNNPLDIINWHLISKDWQLTQAINNLKSGGKFSLQMLSKTSGELFEYAGIYTKVDQLKTIEAKLLCSDRSKISFSELDGSTQIKLTLHTLQNKYQDRKEKWLGILTSFKEYVETH